MNTGQAQIQPDERILRQLAQQQELQGRYDQAGEVYGRLALMRPQDLGMYMSARRCYLETKDYAAWEDLILSLQKRQRDLQYEVDLAQLAFLNGQRESARQKWDEIITANANNERAYSLVGSLLMETQQWDAAASVYLRGRKGLKDDGRFVFELVRIYAQLSDYVRMTEEYLGFLKKNPAQILFIQGQLVSAVKSRQAQDEIVRTVQRELGEGGEMSQLRYRLLGALYTQAKEYGKALAQYQGLERSAAAQKKEESGVWYYTFAQAAISDGAYAEARKSIEGLLAQSQTPEPLKVRAEFLLASILEREDKLAEAISAYEQLVNQWPKSLESESALLRVAAIYFNDLFDVASAEKTYLRLLGRTAAGQPQRQETMQKLSECALVRGDLQRSADFLQALLPEAPPDAEVSHQAQLMLAQLDLYRGRPTAALGRLEKIVESYSVARPGSADDAENDVLDCYIFLQNHKTDSLGLSATGQVMLLQRQRRYAAALDSANRFMETRPQSGVWPRLFEIKIELLRQLKRPEEALNFCRSGLQDSTRLNGETLMRMQADLYDRDLGDRRKALEQYELFLRRYPRSIYVDLVRKRIRELEKSPEPLSED